MVLFGDTQAYTSSRDDNPVWIMGEAEVTNTRRNGRTKIVLKADNAVYWVDSRLVPDETSVVAQIVDASEDDKQQENYKEDEPIKEKDLKDEEFVDGIVHVVRRGDTIQSIAETYHVSVPTVVNASGCNTVYVGQLIFLPRS